MRLGFITGALAAGLAVAALATLVTWLVAVVDGTGTAWTVAAWLVPVIGALGAVATYAAEVLVQRATDARKRATGEPWAYRED